MIHKTSNEDFLNNNDESAMRNGITFLQNHWYFFSCDVKCQVSSAVVTRVLLGPETLFLREFLPSPKGIQTAGHEN